MIGLLIAGGNKINYNILKKYCKESFIVCADSGIENIIETDIIPDVVVGDFDSISREGIQFIEKHNIKAESYPSEKDFTDTEAALDILLKKDVDEIIILSGTGTRLDHTLSNMLLLGKLFGKMKVKLIDNNNEVHYVRKGLFEFYKDDYKYISVISISKNLEYSTEGLKYETNHLVISRNIVMGVSNEIINKKCKIEIHSGEGFVIKSKD